MEAPDVKKVKPLKGGGDIVKIKRMITIGLLLVMIHGLASAGVKITAEQAKSIAINAVDTEEVGVVTDVELENEDGILVYAVEFTKDGIETDVKINDESGEVVKIESDKDEITEEEEGN